MANVYRFPHAALADVATGMENQHNRAAAIQQGAPLNTADLIAAKRQYEQRKSWAVLGGATPHEVFLAEMRHLEVLEEHRNLDNVAPAWAQALLNHINNRFEYSDARNYNRMFVRLKSMRIERVPHKTSGVMPQDNVWFFDTVDDLNAADDHEVIALLQFYEVPLGDHFDDNLGRLKQYLGIVDL